MTVKQRMENDLWGFLSLEPPDVFQAMPVIMRKLSKARVLVYKYLAEQNRQITEDDVPRMEDCWDTDENIYTKESIDYLWNLVKSRTLDWCVMKINSMK